MGWSGGSELVEKMIQACKGADEHVRRRIYTALIEYCWDNDWDTEDEVEGLDNLFDEIMKVEFQDRWGE